MKTQVSRFVLFTALQLGAALQSAIAETPIAVSGVTPIVAPEISPIGFSSGAMFAALETATTETFWPEAVAPENVLGANGDLARLVKAFKDKGLFSGIGVAPAKAPARILVHFAQCHPSFTVSILEHAPQFNELFSLARSASGVVLTWKELVRLLDKRVTKVVTEGIETGKQEPSAAPAVVRYMDYLLNELVTMVGLQAVGAGADQYLASLVKLLDRKLLETIQGWESGAKELNKVLAEQGKTLPESDRQATQVAATVYAELAKLLWPAAAKDGKPASGLPLAVYLHTQLDAINRLNAAGAIQVGAELPSDQHASIVQLAEGIWGDTDVAHALVAVGGGILQAIFVEQFVHGVRNQKHFDTALSLAPSALDAPPVTLIVLGAKHDLASVTKRYNDAHPDSPVALLWVSASGELPYQDGMCGEGVKPNPAP